MTGNEFKMMRLDSAGIEKAQELGDIFTDALHDIEGIVPSGRELSIVVTRLQEAYFWAIRGMAKGNAAGAGAPLVSDYGKPFDYTKSFASPLRRFA